MTRRGGILTMAVLLASWQVTSGIVSGSLLPGPFQVAEALVRETANGLGWHAGVSAARVLSAMVLAVLAAAPLGLVLGQSRRWTELLSPAIYLTYPVPKIVLLPIIMLFLGIGDASKVFIIWLILFYQVLVVVRDASSGVRPELVQSVYSLGANRWQLLRYVYLPACTPAIITALRVSTGTAIAVLFISESFATQSGLGYYIMVEAWGRLAYPEMYAGVVAMSLLGLAIYYLLDRLEDRVCEWAKLPAMSSINLLNPTSQSSALRAGIVSEDDTAGKGMRVRRMFARIVPRYDLMNRLMTVGQDQKWRQLAARAANPSGACGLDVATGTGEFARALLSEGASNVIGLDFCSEMLVKAQGKSEFGGGSSVRLVQGDAHRLPFADETFDFVTSGFLLRNVANLEATLGEMMRVLRPGGRLVSLEITHPEPGPLGWLSRPYFNFVVPVIGWLVTGDRDAYTYLPRSLARFPDAPTLSATILRVGARDVSYVRVGMGTVAIHVGIKPVVPPAIPSHVLH